MTVFALVGTVGIDFLFCSCKECVKDLRVMDVTCGKLIPLDIAIFFYVDMCFESIGGFTLTIWAVFYVVRRFFILGVFSILAQLINSWTSSSSSTALCTSTSSSAKLLCFMFFQAIVLTYRVKSYSLIFMGFMLSVQRSHIRIKIRNMESTAVNKRSMMGLTIFIAKMLSNILQIISRIEISDIYYWINNTKPLAFY